MNGDVLIGLKRWLFWDRTVFIFAIKIRPEVREGIGLFKNTYLRAWLHDIL